MATKQLVKHGTEAGYREHKSLGPDVCDRCRRAHRVFDKQYTKKGKLAGLKYGRWEVIDHLDNSDKASYPRTNLDNRREQSNVPPAGSPSTATSEPSRPGLGQRLTDALEGFTLTAERIPDDYLPIDEVPEYLNTEGLSDPEPGSGEWAKVTDEPFRMTAADYRLIEENMGTYVSIVGMTLELIDPYCGRILGDNIENMVKRWSKVVGHYPPAAKLFMAKGGGILMDWIAAIQATWPFLYALYEHHLARTVRTEGGRVMRVHSPNGQAPNVDATLPDQEFEYTTQ